MSNMNAIEGHAFVMVCTAVMNDEGNGNEIMRMTAKDLGRTPLGVVSASTPRRHSLTFR